MERQARVNAYRFIRPLVNVHLDDTYAYALLTFLCLAAKNSDGASWHSIASIRYTTGMGIRAIRSATKALVEAGLIACEVRGTATNKQSKLYRVNYEALLELEKQSKAARKEFLAGARKQKADEQRIRRSKAACKADVGCAEGSTKADVECAGELHVECAEALHVGGSAAPLTAKLELCKESTTNTNSTAKEATDNSGSGVRDNPPTLDEQISATRSRLSFWQKKAKDSQAGSPDIDRFSRQMRAAQMRLDQLMATGAASSCS